MKEKLISVIVPCYNVEIYVEECINSLIEQTIGYEKMEIILVDDCSTDGTFDILKKYEREYYDTIILVKLGENVKQGGARNVGLEYATGEFISFVDADDFIRKDMYEILYTLIKQYECDLIQFRYKLFSNYGDIKRELEEEYIDIIKKENYNIYNYSENLKKYLINLYILNESCTTKFYRKSFIDEHKFRFAERTVYEEPMFTYPMKFYVEKVLVLEKCLYFYRVNESGTIFGYMKNPATIIDHIYVQIELRSMMEKTEFYDKYRDEMDYYFVHSFYVETLYFMKQRNWTISVKLWRFLKRELLIHVPFVFENMYLNAESLKDERELVNLISIEEDDDKMQSIINEKVRDFGY